MTTVVAVLVVLYVLLGLREGPREPPSREQLLRDQEDIAIYGAVVRPPLDEDDRPGG